MRKGLVVGVVVVACGGSTVNDSGLTTGLDAYWKLDGDTADSTGHGLALSAAPGQDNGVPAFLPGTIGLRVNGKETTATFSGAVGAQSTWFVAENRAGYPWQGVVDEVGKWGRALTGAEMDQLYAKGAGLTLP